MRTACTHSSANACMAHWFHFYRATLYAKRGICCRRVVIANDLEWVWRSLLLSETFVIPITHKKRVLTTIYTICNLSFVVKNEGVLKVTGSHVHFKSGSVLKTVIETLKQQSTNRKWYAVGPFNSSNCDDLGCMSRSFIDCKLFYTDKCVANSLGHSRAFVVIMLLYGRRSVHSKNIRKFTNIL